MSVRSVLVTGAGGYLGSQLLPALKEQGDEIGRIVAVDVRETPAGRRLPGVDYRVMDVRSADLTGLFLETAPEVVVHLASIVTPGKDSTASSNIPSTCAARKTC